MPVLAPWTPTADKMEALPDTSVLIFSAGRNETIRIGVDTGDDSGVMPNERWKMQGDTAFHSPSSGSLTGSRAQAGP